MKTGFRVRSKTEPPRSPAKGLSQEPFSMGAHDDRVAALIIRHLQDLLHRVANGNEYFGYKLNAGGSNLSLCFPAEFPEVFLNFLDIILPASCFLLFFNTSSTLKLPSP